jgi:hypothetical protein
MLPVACVRHKTSNRARLKIPGCKGDDEYFSGLEKKFSGWKKFDSVKVNPGTGTILLVIDEIDLEAINQYAQKQSLFQLPPDQRLVPRLVEQAISPFRKLNSQIEQSTSGELNLTEAAFIGLLIMGLYQVFRGRIGPLPWYSAFWYAFGIFSKSLVDKTKTT